MKLRSCILLSIFLFSIIPLISAQDDGNCIVSKAGWVDSSGNILLSAKEGEDVVLGVSFGGCAGKQAAFTILEFDGYDSNGEPLGDIVDRINGGTIPEDGLVFVQWSANYVKDQPDENGDDPEFLFAVAALENSSVVAYDYSANLLPVLPIKTIEDRPMEIVDLCGDGICDENEDVNSCPKDCVSLPIETLKKIGILLAFALGLFLIGLIIYSIIKYIKHRKKGDMPGSGGNQENSPGAQGPVQVANPQQTDSTVVQSNPAAPVQQNVAQPNPADINKNPPAPSEEPRSV